MSFTYGACGHPLRNRVVRAVQSPRRRRREKIKVEVVRMKPHCKICQHLNEDGTFDEMFAYGVDDWRATVVDPFNMSVQHTRRSALKAWLEHQGRANNYSGAPKWKPCPSIRSDGRHAWSNKHGRFSCWRCNGQHGWFEHSDGRRWSDKSAQRERLGRSFIEKWDVTLEEYYEIGDGYVRHIGQEREEFDPRILRAAFNPEERACARPYLNPMNLLDEWRESTPLSVVRLKGNVTSAEVRDAIAMNPGAVVSVSGSVTFD